MRPYAQRAPEIRFLALPQIDEQLFALRFTPQLQTIVAVLIYAGLRREELLWLTLDDVDLKHGASGMLRIRAKTIAGESWQPKTKLNRAVAGSRALRPYLDRHTPRPTTAPACSSQFRGWLFPSPTGAGDGPAPPRGRSDRCWQKVREPRKVAERLEKAKQLASKAR